ncbi:MAG: hypothetical protein LBB26_04000 [Puniceicoccales bacterium]|jgi:hypothetical protein|nr:hypothetical protein [Puniceicoccales bacterium]
MKSTTDTTANTANIFNGGLELQAFPALGLTPDFKLGPSFLREFPASLGRASPLPAAKVIWEISPYALIHPIGESMGS